MNSTTEWEGIDIKQIVKQVSDNYATSDEGEALDNI